MSTHGLRFLSCNLGTHSRRKDRSAAAAAAYILRTGIIDSCTGRLHDFTRSGKKPPLADGMEGWAGSCGELISAMARAEKRWDAVEARELRVALPNELAVEEAVDVVSFLSELLVQIFGVAVLWAVHPPDTGGDSPNLHAHLLFTTRRTLDGRTLGQKTRELDRHETGSVAVKALRETWAEILNEFLRERGHNANIELRSFASLGIDAVPGRHRGERETAKLRRRQRPPLPCPESGPVATPAKKPAKLVPPRSDAGFLQLPTPGKQPNPEREGPGPVK